MGTKFSEDVVPLTDLKVNPGRVVKHAADTRRPVLLTSRGRCRRRSVRQRLRIELAGINADYCVVCLPNHLHAVAARLAMRNGMNVILEKPATLSVNSLEDLQEVERETGKKCYCILQMRLHPSAGRISLFCSDICKVQIEYHTPRGPWYWESWKRDKQKSGGILFSIGVHLVDLALWIFGGRL